MISHLKYKFKHSSLFIHLTNSKIVKWLILKKIRRWQINNLKSEATSLLKDGAISEQEFQDYLKKLKETLCSFSEYKYQYEFYKLSSKERRAFITRLEMRLWYEKNVPQGVRLLFWNKKKWLTAFDTYIHREWFDPTVMNFEEFKQLLNPDKEYIAKPEEGSLGEGIFKFSVHDLTELLFDRLHNQKYLVEELIHNNKLLAAYHPFSLNTIRITTLLNGTVLWAFIRFGNNGNLVDNAHAGGIFATINPENGIVESDGIDTFGNHYSVHPYSNLHIRGLQIPRWDELTCKACELHRSVPEIPIIGWDMCINSNNQIEVIEGNHFSDIDLAQSPMKIGLRDTVNRKLKEIGFPCV